MVERPRKPQIPDQNPSMHQLVRSGEGSRGVPTAFHLESRVSRRRTATTRRPVRQSQSSGVCRALLGQIVGRAPERLPTSAYPGA